MSFFFSLIVFLKHGETNPEKSESLTHFEPVWQCGLPMPHSPPRNWAPCCDLGTCLTSQLCNHFLIVLHCQCEPMPHIQAANRNGKQSALGPRKWSNDPLHSVFILHSDLPVFLGGKCCWVLPQNRGGVQPCASYAQTPCGDKCVPARHGSVRIIVMDHGLFFRKAGFWSTTSISTRAEQHQPQPFI